MKLSTAATNHTQAEMSQFRATFSRVSVAFLLSVTVALSSVACSDKTGELPAAPAGDKSTLEKLADAYRIQAERLPTSPVNMHPDARMKFIQSVFSQAGYNYHKTLLDLADTEPTQLSQNHRDLGELLRLPHYALAADIKKQLYTADQLKAIEKIEAW